LLALVGPPMEKPAILFDIDGTLVDSNDAHVEAWQRAFAAEGYSFGRTEVHAQVGKGGDNLVPSLLPDVSVEIQERLAATESEIYMREFMRQVEPFEGAREVLKSLAERGHTVVLASSASRAEVDYYIDLLDADGFISGTTSKDDVRRSKPCPDIFTAALALTGRPAASAIVIGDTPYDMVAARRAGSRPLRCSRAGLRARSSRPAPRSRFTTASAISSANMRSHRWRAIGL
jgi:HAD superfamily hydrolase (TIGR01549 family)